MKENKGRFQGWKKLAAIIAGVAVVAAMGTVTAFAANDGLNSLFGPVPESLGVKNINVAPCRDAVGGEVLHIVKNGINLYSVDGGVIWNDTIPDGFRLDGKGNLEKIK